MAYVEEPDAPQPTCEGSAFVYLTEQQKQELLSQLNPAEAAEMEHLLIVREP